MVENTTQRDPLVHLLGAMSEGTGNYITGMEADGQRQLVGSTRMPTDAPWDDLTALGFTRGDDVPGDALFCEATLPAGWSKVATDHSMWSEIVDERGIERVGVFYKAAFYDRSAHASISRPGYALASEVIYGDAEPAMPSCWDVLTEDERADFWGRLDEYVQQAEKYPGTRLERLPRVTTVLALRDA